MEKELVKKKNTININTVVNYIIILLKTTKTKAANMFVNNIEIFPKKKKTSVNIVANNIKIFPKMKKKS